MRRYQWTLLKTLEFLNSRRPDLEIRANFIHQLTAYENRLVSQGLGPKTSKWTEVFEKTNDFENEELLLRNTYLNAQMGPFVDYSLTSDKPRPAKIKWIDDNPKSKMPLATEIGTEEPKQINIQTAPDTVPSAKQPQKLSRNAKGIPESASASAAKEEKKVSKEAISSKNAKEAKTVKPVKQNSARDPNKNEEKTDIRSQIASQIAAKKYDEHDIKTASHIVKEQKNQHTMKTQEIKNAAVGRKTVGAEKPILAGHIQTLKDQEINMMPTKYNNFIEPNDDEPNDRKLSIGLNVKPVQSAPIPKPMGYNSKITESINQMMDLNSAMNDKIYKDLPGKTENITHIINQNNINNYIIHNPQKVELIEISQKSQENSQIPPSDQIVKKIIPPKKAQNQPRAASASVKREQPQSKLDMMKDNIREKPRAHIREAKTYENVLVHPHNVTNIIIDKGIPSESIANVPLKLVTAQNNALSSFRKGPVKPTPAVKPPPPNYIMTTEEKPKLRNSTPLTRERPPSAGTAKPAAKKQRPTTAQHARPASPGIRGKVAEAPYKNTIKSYGVPTDKMVKGKINASPRQVMAQQQMAKTYAGSNAAVASVNLRGLSPAKPRWKA